MSGASVGPDAGVEGPPVWHAGHAAQRTLGGTVAFYATTLAFCGALFLQGVTEALGVSAAQGVIAIGGATLVSTVAALLYRRSGVSTSYLIADAAETYALAAAYGYLIWAAGSSRAFFWILYIAHVPIIATAGTVAHNMALTIALPATLAVARLFSGDLAGFAVCVVAGLLGHLMYRVLARVTDELEATRLREAELKLKLVKLGVLQERGRIAQDLHDSLGAQLAGLVWRVRAITSRVNGPLRGDLASIEARIVESIQELRDVVVCLRPSLDTWNGMVGLLRDRCEELAGDRALVFSAEARAPVGSHPVYGEVPLIVFELVRNAARHAKPSKIEVLVTCEQGELRLRVADDGVGLGTREPTHGRGGLGNVERRVVELGGRATVESDRTGTRFDVAIPLAK